ncbi:MAG TPA: glycosyltransferase [bacterium]|nr:glycosyltransferase [bacterium]
MAEKNKIKVIHYIFKLNNLGGAELQVLNIVNFLDKSLFETFVLTINVTSEVLEKFNKKNIKVINLEINNIFKIYRIILIPFIFIKYKIDILHTHFFYAHLTGRIFGFFCGIKKIFSTEHNLIDWTQRNILLRKLNYFTVYYLTDKIIAISNSVAEILKQNNIQQNKILKIYNGIDIKKYSQKIGEDKKQKIKEELNIKNEIVLLTIARLEKRKGLNYLIEAVEKLRKINIKLLIVGAGKEYKNLTKQVEILKLTNKVLFTGAKQNVNEILQIADLFIMPSISEGLGIAIIEALAAGVPVIATNTGGIPEIVENNVNGILVEPQNSDALANAILKILTDGELLNFLKSNAQNSVCQKFDIREIIKIYQELYQI